jgi:hypothetical protein
MSHGKVGTHAPQCEAFGVNAVAMSQAETGNRGLTAVGAPRVGAGEGCSES